MMTKSKFFNKYVNYQCITGRNLCALTAAKPKHAQSFPQPYTV
jgi:hypothetical protein